MTITLMTRYKLSVYVAKEIEISKILSAVKIIFNLFFFPRSAARLAWQFPHDDVQMFNFNTQKEFPCQKWENSFKFACRMSQLAIYIVEQL